MYIDFLIDVLKENSAKTAIVYKEKEYSYEMLINEYEKWNIYLKEKGVENNSIICLISDFSPESIGLMLALINLGTIFVPMSVAVKDPQKLIDIAETEYCIKLVNNQVSFQKLNNKPGNELLLRLKESKNPGLILFSSGITGEPKAAVHDMSLLLEKYKIPGKTLKTIAFLMFDHIGGFNTLFHILSNGGMLVVTEERSPDEVCRLIEKFNVELLPTTPTFINMILFNHAYERFNLSSLKIVSYGTEPMNESTLKSFHKLFPDVHLKQTYGLSEVGIMRTKSESSDSLWIKVGGEDYETKIVDGKFWIKAKTAMLGYLNAPSPFDEDGWFNTKDCVEQKGDYIRFLGRASELINVGGEKVYPIEVESILLEIEGVKDASVHGEPHPLLGRIVVAEVAVDEMNNNKEFILKIKKYCQSKLEKYKIPVKIILRNEISNNYRFKKLR